MTRRKQVRLRRKANAYRRWRRQRARAEFAALCKSARYFAARLPGAVVPQVCS